MKKEQEHTLTAIRECLAKNMPPYGKAILFGSQARGIARDDRDRDILVILDKDQLLPSAYEVKESLTQAFKELREAETSEVKLPDARNLFK